MLNIKALGHLVSEKKILRFYHVFPNIGLSKTCDPKAGHFGPRDISWTKLGRGPLGDATYKLSRL